MLFKIYVSKTQITALGLRNHGRREAPVREGLMK